ncbi:MAG: ABC-F family ATP-binding cassette domain-containing protein [Sedimentisphaerales bacterium]|nr:ABC-F family ATP-binding cassette domain-containing protein [Sedimentisphaerales bacterium]
MKFAKDEYLIMAIVVFKNISKEYAGRYVLDGIFFEINAGRKMGLIGPNGSGKTTILRILSGLEEPTDGSISIAGDVRIGYVPQYVEIEEDRTVWDYVLKEHARVQEDLRHKEERLARAEADGMDAALSEYQKARDRFDRMGGDHFVQRARALLESLGLSGRTDNKVSQLSGGEKNVLSMTHALLADPNLLILDEPGNHLDYMGLAWLDEFLRQFRGAVLIVSHNRYLLDRVVDGILELDEGKLNIYSGNYSQSRVIRMERLKSQQAQYVAYQKRLDHLEALVRKFGDIAQGHASDNTWGRRLRARRSQLERERAKAVDKPVFEKASINPDFQTDPTRADIAMQIRDYSKAYDKLKLFEHIDWDIAGGTAWALIGPNGCGKTTLLRDIVREGHWEHPVIRIGPSFTIGYCAQEQEVLAGDNTVFEELMSIKDTVKEQVLGILARFLFRDEEVYKKISNLSGGERNRLQLARLMLLKPNFLILDEPTNHLDIPTREAVEEALSEFEGTILVVSHDRYFLDKVVDHVAEVRDRRLKLSSGNFSQFWQSRKEGGIEPQSVTGRITHRARSRVQTKEDKSKPGGGSWRERKAEAAARRKEQRRIEKIERQIAETEQEKQMLEEQVAEAFTRGDNEQGQMLSQDLRQVIAQLEELYQVWLEREE